MGEALACPERGTRQCCCWRMEDYRQGKGRVRDEWDSWKPRYLEQKSTAFVASTPKKEEPSEDPYETIQDAHDELIKQLANDIISRALGMEPSSFEYLIAELLSKMGYGK